jgi:DNA polymerase gamma 1
MEYLARRYNIDCRLAITVHDEIRYLVKEQDKYRAAMAMQIANLWTRAMFAQQMGINELPQSCAYFSAVDIDHVLRKEVDMDCVTPSHSTPIPHGESLGIEALLDKGSEARLDPSIVPTDPPQPELYSYTPRTPVMAALRGADPTAPEALAYLKAQISSDDKELRDALKMLKPSTPPAPKTRKARSKSQDEYEDDLSASEISQSVQHYQQMAQLLPVDDLWREVYKKADKVGKGKSKKSGPGLYGQWNVHPRSTGPRVRATG